MSNESRILAAQIERAMDDEPTVERQITRYHFLKDFESLAGLASALQSALADEQEARKKAEEDANEVGVSLLQWKQRAEAAEALIKASREQEPVWYAAMSLEAPVINRAIRSLDGAHEYADGCRENYGGVSVVELYAQPPIPPDVAELQRQLEEAKRVPEFALELPDDDDRKVKVWFVEKRADGKWHISISVDK